MTRIRALLPTLAVVILATTACSTSPAEVPALSVDVSLGASQLMVGQTATAVAVVHDQNGNIVEGQPISWSSSNQAIATVGAGAQVAALAVGSVQITATSGSASGSAPLTVLAVPPVAVSSVTVALASASLTAGQTTQATATTRSASNTVLTGRAIAWSSDNASVATVSSTGLVTSLAAGTAQITATSEGKSGSAAVTVTAPAPAPVASVSVTLASSSLTVGQSTQATAVTRDAGNSILTGRAITWSSDNTAVATVSGTGLVTSVAVGTAHIIATSEGQSGNATATVSATPPVPVASVTVALGSAALTVGQTTQATATTRDANNVVLTGRSIAWSSDNTAVATVSGTGVVTSVAAGTAHIIATSETKSGNATVTVSPVPPAPVALVTVSLAAGALTVGQTTQATAITRDANNAVLTGRTITWSSDNTTVATVSGTGLVTAATAGTAHIVATSEGKSGNATLTVTAPTQTAAECATPGTGWIFCDDFESDRTGSYFEYNSPSMFARATGTGYGGSWGMRATYATGQTAAGSLALAFGRTPSSYFRPADAGTANYREIYWRFYYRREAGWVGNGAMKLTRAMILAKADWSQAMIAHGWTSSSDDRYLMIDPARGTDASGNLITVGYNDFNNLTWLGGMNSAAPEEDQAHVGQWACYEYHLKLNDAGQSNGVFEFRVNGQISAQKTGLNFVGAYNAYGINSVLLENFVNTGAPAANKRTFDNFVVSTQPIGCLP